jgi:guanosine-3',5'-bis(diphosphate) 3'-pyrophosphohydrolase
MSETLVSTYRPLLEAVSFAARAHRGQVRKDGMTPYIAHPLRVCLVLRHVFGIDDPKALTAAALHDTIEDTTTDFDDLEERFGADVAGWVAALSKDSRMRHEERERAYEAQVAQAPWQVKVCKLADMFDNLMDLATTRPEQRTRTFKKIHLYLDALKTPPVPEPVRRPYELVSALLAELEAKESGGIGGA